MRYSNLLKTMALTGVLVTAACRGAFATPAAGDAFPDLASYKLEGKLPDSLKGRIVLVDFWASWCGPCKMSFPALNALLKKYGASGLVIVAVNVDEARADMEKFLRDTPADFTVVRDASQKLVSKVDVQTMPNSFLLDRDGKVRFAHTGFERDKTPKQYEQEIESLLKK